MTPIINAILIIIFLLYCYLMIEHGKCSICNNNVVKYPQTNTYNSNTPIYDDNNIYQISPYLI